MLLAMKIKAAITAAALASPFALTIITIIFSLLLVSRFELFALKFKNFSWADNKTRYILIISAVVLLATLNFTSIPIIIILYIILSLIDNYTNKKKAINISLTKS